MSQWFYQNEGAESGPFSVEELHFLVGRGKLRRDSLVRRSNESQWQSAKVVPGLFNKQQTSRERSPSPMSSPPVGQESAIVPLDSSTEAQATESTLQPAPDPQPVQTLPLPPLRDDQQTKERRKRVLLGMFIGSGVVLLILLLLLLFLTVGQFGQGEVADAGSGGSPGSGGLGAGQENLTADAGPESTEIGDSNSPAPVDNPGDQETSRAEVPPVDKQAGNLFELAALNEPAAEVPAASSNNVGGGVLGGGGGGGSGGASEFFGVKVRGKIALVCDTSGSMSSDFPVLVRELREKFPKNTPLILVEGCIFAPPNPNAPPPQRLIDLRQQLPYMGTEFADDPHVYRALSTTDAILFAVEKLKRNTVMFNNDLQDGGSEKAIAAFEQLRKKRRFTLSGRSLNCEAPDCLLKFIKSSEGDFKLDPISRSPSPAQLWSR